MKRKPSEALAWSNGSRIPETVKTAADLIEVFKPVRTSRIGSGGINFSAALLRHD